MSVSRSWLHCFIFLKILPVHFPFVSICSQQFWKGSATFVYTWYDASWMRLGGRHFLPHEFLVPWPCELAFLAVATFPCICVILSQMVQWWHNCTAFFLLFSFSFSLCHMRGVWRSLCVRPPARTKGKKCTGHAPPFQSESAVIFPQGPCMLIHRHAHTCSYADV